MNTNSNNSKSVNDAVNAQRVGNAVNSQRVGNEHNNAAQVRIAHFGSPDKLGGKILNFPEKVIPLCHE